MIRKQYNQQHINYKLYFLLGHVNYCYKSMDSDKRTHSNIKVTRLHKLV